MSSGSIEEQVWSVVQAMNRTWTVERRPERLVDYFHADMVAIPGNERRRREGRSECVAAWTAFVERARVTRWEERNPKVQVWADGKAAVVHYDYDITCEMGGRVVDLAGRDTLVLVMEDGRWWVVADHFSSFPD